MVAEKAIQKSQRNKQYTVVHKAQSAIQDKILLLKRCLIMSAADRPNSINTIALKPCGVAAVESIKIPTNKPDVTAVSSEQNIHIGINRAIGSNGLTVAILMEKIPLY